MSSVTRCYPLANVDSLRDYFVAQLAKLERYFEQIHNVAIVSIVERRLKTAKTQRRLMYGQVDALIQHDDTYATIGSQVITLECQVLKPKKLTYINDGT
ncbi:hypothetical protein [Shewanella sp.]|uniref:hypothetical protein n=1 Tax=Shewanella sp. TaxID=50422 RepID=UPI003A97C18D